MLLLGCGEERDVTLYRLPLAELLAEDSVSRTDLLVVPINLPEEAGYHGLLGMNWLRTFLHVGFINLQTERPILELHDPS